MAKKIKFSVHIGTMIPCPQGIFRVSQEKKKKKLVVRHFRKNRMPGILFCFWKCPVKFFDAM
jgi:hypothetical protein